MIVTTELRLKDRAGCKYLENLLEEENKVFMFAFREMKSPRFYENYRTTSELNSRLCREFGILSRRANSAIYRVRALLESYREAKSWEIKDKSLRLEKLEDQLEEKRRSREKLKALAAENRLSEKELRRLRRLNESVYHLANKVNALRQKIKSIKKDLKNGKYRIGIGGKDFFKKQFHLEGTPYNSHQEWREAFRESATRSYLTANIVSTQIIELIQA